jgi:hypothetical protein
MFDEAELDVIRYVCPECISGKCNNCNGIANIDNDNNPVACYCKSNPHPNRLSHADRAYYDVDAGESSVLILQPREDLGRRETDGGTWVISQTFNMTTRQIIEEEWVALPGFPANVGGFKLPGTPSADPGEVSLFIEDGNITGEDIRLRPDAQIVKDFLMDVQVRNPKGEWVPAVPMPIFLWFGRCQCHCGKKRWTRVSYMEHYAYAHILGMED